MMDQFYITLPSNTEENNTISKFRAQLPNPIELEGQWEVALAEVQYPFSWNNIELTTIAEEQQGLGNLLFVAFRPGALQTRRVSIRVPECHYSTIEELLEAFRIVISRKKVRETVIVKTEGNKKTKKTKTHLLSDLISIQYMPLEKRITIKMDTKFIKGAVLGERLQYVFGFASGRSGLLSRAENKAKFPPDLQGGFSTLYIYCDLVQPQVVGNILAPLLRTVAVRGLENYGHTINEIFLAPHYLPVRSKNFSSVHLEIKNDLNELVPFKFGKAVLKLHFRKLQ